MGILTLMSQPSFHLEMTLESLDVMHLTYNGWLSGTAIVCTMKSPNQQLQYAPAKVNNINIRLSLTLYLQLLASAAPQFVQQPIKPPKYDTSTLRQ